MSAIWHVDDGEYKSTYFQAVFQAENALSADLLDLVSIPEATALPEEYVRSSIRLLIVGQETLGNRSTSLSRTSPYFAWQEQMGGNIAFDYAYGGDRQAGDAFWRAFESIKESFSFRSRRALAWSNILKTQLLNPIKGSHSVVHLGNKCMPLVEWQRELFQAEIKFIAPQAVLFLTGGRRWVLNHMYKDVQVTPIKGAGYDVVEIPALPIPMVQTYHPRAYNTRSPGTLASRVNAIGFLKENMYFR